MKAEEKIKQHLTIYRTTHGKTQAQMAEILGVSTVTYQEMEKGIVRSLRNLNRIKEKTGYNEKTTHILSGEAGKEISDLKIKTLMVEAGINTLLPEMAKVLAILQNEVFSEVYGKLVRARQKEFEELHKVFLKEQVQGE